MSIKKYSFSKIKEKAEKLRSLWQNVEWKTPSDEFLMQNDFAPLIGTICDQQVNSNDAWNFPRWLNDKIGGFDLSQLLEVNYQEVLQEYFKDKWPKSMKNELRREYVERVSKDIREALELFQKEGKSPVTMFENRPYTALEVYFTLRRIPGIGPKKANTITRDFLYRTLGLLKNYHWFDQIKERSPKFDVIEGRFLDMPIDVHVVKVFNRIFGRKHSYNRKEGWRGELSEHIQDILAFSKLAFPDLPVKLDQIFWTVGHEYCHERNPNCEECPIAKICDNSLK